GPTGVGAIAARLGEGRSRPAMTQANVASRGSPGTSRAFVPPWSDTGRAVLLSPLGPDPPCAHGDGALGAPHCCESLFSATYSSMELSSARPSVRCGAILLSNAESAEPIAMCMSRYL